MPFKQTCLIQLESTIENGGCSVAVLPVSRLIVEGIEAVCRTSALVGVVSMALVIEAVVLLPLHSIKNMLPVARPAEVAGAASACIALVSYKRARRPQVRGGFSRDRHEEAALAC